jgi:uncharacterized protein (DUF4415 family)
MPTKKISGAHALVDPDDSPRLGRDWFEKADLYRGRKPADKGSRPKSPAPKIAIRIRLSPDSLAYFKAGGPGWQTRIDQALRKAARL